MVRWIMLLLLSLPSFSEGKEGNHVLYEVIAQKHEVLPTVVYPPSGGDRMPKKSLLGTFSLGKELQRFNLGKDFLSALYDRVRNADNSNEPFFARGSNYVLKTPNDEFYLIFFEDDARLEKELAGKRFRMSLLLKIAEKEPVFVRSSKAGGVCRDETILRILKRLGGDSDNAHKKNDS